jgi:hypothetical protein
LIRLKVDSSSAQHAFACEMDDKQGFGPEESKQQKRDYVGQFASR